MKIQILIIFIIIFLVQTISALTITIDMPSSFSQGEQMYFDYTILSDIEEEQVIFTPHITCPNAPISLLQDKIISLNASIPYDSSYNDLIITGDTEPQTCIAHIQVSSPIQLREEKSFIIDALPSFSFEIKLDKIVFIKNQDINIDYMSEVESPQITATLISPSGKSEDIEIPSTLNLNKIGTYIIEVTASKTGYKTMQVSKQIGIIDKEAEIAEGILTPRKGKTILWVLLVVGLIILVSVVVYLIYGKIKKLKEQKLEPSVSKI
tara:strand:+ start:408 stop:1202 length:795 start_codon:yes stop_codon:yes gene_type:complete